MTSISWWRSWHGAPTDHKWAVIAARSGVKVGIVSAIAWALLDYASQHKERGSVIGIDTEVYSVYSGFSEEEITAVIQAMTDKGIITEGRLTNWDKRQPQSEEKIENVRQWREKNKLLSNVTESYTDKELRVKSKIKDKDKDKEKDKEEEAEKTTPLTTSPLPPIAPFDCFCEYLNSKGIMPNNSDVNIILDLLKTGIILDDLQAGFAWRADNNDGKAIRFVSQLIGPAKVAMQKRLQTSTKKDGKKTMNPDTILYDNIRFQIDLAYLRKHLEDYQTNEVIGKWLLLDITQAEIGEWKNSKSAVEFPWDKPFEVQTYENVKTNENRKYIEGQYADAIEH